MKPVKDHELFFRQLFKEHYNFLCNWLNKRIKCWDTSEEIAQKTFVKLWEKRQCLDSIQDFRQYLIRSASNNLIDQIRTQRRFVKHSHAYEYLREKESYVSTEFYQEDLWMSELASAVERLKQKPRQIFLLSKQDGLTYDEISEFLDIPRRTVEYNMKIALSFLRHQLKGVLDR